MPHTPTHAPGHSQPFPADVHLVIAPPRNRVASHEAPTASMAGTADDESAALNPPSVISTSATAHAVSPLLSARAPFSHRVRLPPAELALVGMSGDAGGGGGSSMAMHDTWLHLAMPPMGPEAAQPQGAATPHFGGGPDLSRDGRNGGSAGGAGPSKRARKGKRRSSAGASRGGRCSREAPARSSGGGTGSHSTSTSVSIVGSVSVGPLEAPKVSAAAAAAMDVEPALKQWSAWGDHLSAKTVLAAVKAAPVRGAAAGDAVPLEPEASGASGSSGGHRGLDPATPAAAHTDPEDNGSTMGDAMDGALRCAVPCCALLSP